MTVNVSKSNQNFSFYAHCELNSLSFAGTEQFITCLDRMPCSSYNLLTALEEVHFKVMKNFSCPLFIKKGLRNHDYTVRITCYYIVLLSASLPIFFIWEKQEMNSCEGMQNYYHEVMKKNGLPFLSLIYKDAADRRWWRDSSSSIPLSSSTH